MDNKAAPQAWSSGVNEGGSGSVRRSQRKWVQCQSVDLQPLLSSCELSNDDVSLMRSDSSGQSCFSMNLEDMFVFGKGTVGEGLGGWEGEERGWCEVATLEGWCADTTEVRDQ